MNLTSRQIWATFRVATHYGGSFYAALGEAGLLGDPENQARLLAAFPKLVEQYGPETAFYQRMFPTLPNGL